MENKIDIQQKDACVVVELNGDIDTALAMSFKRKLDDLRDRHRKIVIDLTNTLYINSTGLGVILSEYKRKYFDISLIIPKRNTNILQITESLNMQNFFKIYENLEAVI